MRLDVFDAYTAKKIGTVTEADGKLVVDSDDEWLISEVTHYQSVAKITPENFFGLMSRRFETATEYHLFNDEGVEIVIAEDGTVVSKPTQTEEA
jgi:hypothetical protein